MIIRGQECVCGGWSNLHWLLHHFWIVLLGNNTGTTVIISIMLFEGVGSYFIWAVIIGGQECAKFSTIMTAECIFWSNIIVWVTEVWMNNQLKKKALCMQSSQLGHSWRWWNNCSLYVLSTFMTIEWIFFFFLINICLLRCLSDWAQFWAQSTTWDYKRA